MKTVVAIILAVGLAASPALAEERQRSGSSSRKGRVIGTVVGAAGGFVLGIFAGLHWFDDAVDSDRKVWTTALAFGAAGGAAGYFAGRAASHSNRGPVTAVAAPTPLPRPTFPPARRGHTTSALMPSRAANERIATALSGPVNGIIHGWPSSPGESSSPLPSPRSPR